MQMIIEYTKKNKYKRKIVLVTNGTGVMSDDNIEGIIEKMKEVNIELVIMYVSCRCDFTFMLILLSGADFDDAEYGAKEEDKDSRKVLRCLQCIPIIMLIKFTLGRKRNSSPKPD